MIRSLFWCFTIFISSLMLSACGDKKSASGPAVRPVPVNIYELQPRKVEYSDKFPGTMVALMQVDIRAEVQGYITGIYFKEGSKVKKGQKLYTIDDRKYQASYLQADANVKVAESNLEQAQKDADRYVYLNKHEAVARQTLEHAMTTLQNAKQQLASAKQQMSSVRTDLGYSVITAPFDGTIGISQVKLGNTVVPGQTILNTISTDNPMAVDFVVTEKQIGRFIRLQQKEFHASDSIFSLLLPDNTVYDQPGKIQTIDRGVNPQTGTTIVRLVFPNESMVLRTGMSCIVSVHNDDTAHQLIIPSKAVVEQMGEYFVYVTRDSTLPAGEKGNPSSTVLLAVQKKVVLGQTIEENVIVESGLQAGDKVIVDGVQKLRNGSTVSVGEAAEKPAG